MYSRRTAVVIGAVHIEENDMSFSYSQGPDVEKKFIITLFVDMKIIQLIFGF